MVFHPRYLMSGQPDVAASDSGSAARLCLVGLLVSWAAPGRAGYQMTDKAELETALGSWCSDSTSALGTYGDISTWGTGLVTDMSQLFANGASSCSTSTTFNEDISAWDGERKSKFAHAAFQSLIGAASALT